MKVVTGLVSPLKTNPSIPYKKPTIDDSLSPAKYYPNHNVIHRKSPVTMITPHKISSPHNSGSLNKYIEVFIQDVVDTTSKPHKAISQIIETMGKTKNEESESKEQLALNNSIIHTMSTHMNQVLDNTIKKRDKEGDISFYIEANDHKSIALNTAPIDSNYKMRSPFVSQTERYPEIKPSPGPGSYNLIKDTTIDKSEIKVSPQAFGSTCKYRTHFLNAEKTPFGKPTFLSTPGVGHYYNSKKLPKRIEEEILKEQLEKEEFDETPHKSGFMMSSQRPCLSDVIPEELGPGKYETEKISKLPISDGYNIRKRKGEKSVFISTAPRFKDLSGQSGLNATSPLHKGQESHPSKTHKRKSMTRIL